MSLLNAGIFKFFENNVRTYPSTKKFHGISVLKISQKCIWENQLSPVLLPLAFQCATQFRKKILEGGEARVVSFKRRNFLFTNVFVMEKLRSELNKEFRGAEFYFNMMRMSWPKATTWCILPLFFVDVDSSYLRL